LVTRERKKKKNILSAFFFLRFSFYFYFIYLPHTAMNHANTSPTPTPPSTDGAATREGREGQEKPAANSKTDTQTENKNARRKKTGATKPGVVDIASHCTGADAVGRSAVLRCHHMDACGACGSTAAGRTTFGTGARLMRCARCRHQAYCSRACQKAGWAMHAPLCTGTHARMPKLLEERYGWVLQVPDERAERQPVACDGKKEKEEEEDWTACARRFHRERRTKELAMRREQHAKAKTKASAPKKESRASRREKARREARQPKKDDQPPRPQQQPSPPPTSSTADVEPHPASLFDRMLPESVAGRAIAQSACSGWLEHGTGAVVEIPPQDAAQPPRFAYVPAPQLIERFAPLSLQSGGGGGGAGGLCSALMRTLSELDPAREFVFLPDPRDLGGCFAHLVVDLRLMGVTQEELVKWAKQHDDDRWAELERDIVGGETDGNSGVDTAREKDDAPLPAVAGFDESLFTVAPPAEGVFAFDPPSPLVESNGLPHYVNFGGSV
jgi:hypothetical protein